MIRARPSNTTEVAPPTLAGPLPLVGAGTSRTDPGECGASWLPSNFRLRQASKESLVRLGEFELDLHRTFVTGPFGLTIGLDELFTSGTEISIGTRPLLALSAEHQFLHACYNVALGDYPVRLCSVRDLLLCLQHLDVDLDQIVAIAARWNGTAVVQRAAAAAIETVGAQVAAGFIELHTP